LSRPTPGLPQAIKRALDTVLDELWQNGPINR